MIQFVSGNIEQATELMLFNSAKILLKSTCFTIIFPLADGSPNTVN